MNYNIESGAAFSDNNAEGFTNNWLKERSHENLFKDKYTSYEKPKSYPDTYVHRYLLKGLIEHTPLSDIFFSQLNVKHINNYIAKLIKKRENYIISPESQNIDNLLICMKDIFLEHSQHRPDNIEQQIIDLNYIVIMKVYPIIVSNIKMFISFKRDHSSMKFPFKYPESTNLRGKNMEKKNKYP